MEALWIAVAFGFGLLIRGLGLPPLVGYLAAGFMLNGLGQQGGQLLDHVAHSGVLLLLFGVGLKLRWKSVIRPEVWGGGLLHLAVIGALLGAALHYLVELSLNMALLLGASLGFSSTVLAAKVLEQKRELRAFHGRVAIGILIIQDLVAVGLLSFSGTSTPSPLVLLLTLLPLLRWPVQRLLDLVGHDELLILYGLLLALVMGGLGFEYLGLSSELGALLLGALLAGHSKAHELSDALWGLKEAFLVGFFLQIGLAGWPTLESLGFALLLVLLLPTKAALFFLILIVFRLRARSSFLVGLTLASYSEFALIVAQLMVKSGTLSPSWLVLLAIAIALSFLVAAPLNRLAHSLYERFESRLLPFELAQRHPDEQPISLGRAHILILGMGRTGSAAYDFLHRRHAERVVGLDSDLGKVEMHLHQGRRVLYADAEDPGFWHTLKLVEIKAVILTMPDAEAKLIATKQLRRRGFSGLIGTTSDYPDEAQTIAAAGADMTFMSFDEAGAGLAEHVWHAIYDDVIKVEREHV